MPMELGMPDHGANISWCHVVEKLWHSEIEPHKAQSGILCDNGIFGVQSKVFS